MKRRTKLFLPLSLVFGSVFSMSVGFISANHLNSKTIANIENTTTEHSEPKPEAKANKPFVMPTNLKELQECDPAELAKQPAYDSRNFGIVTPVKNQGSEGICWAYAGSAVAETNVLREGLTTDQNMAIFNPNYMDYATKKRNSTWNIMDINRNDILTKPLFNAGAAAFCEQTYSVWAAPALQSLNVSDTYVKPPYYLTESEFFMDENDKDSWEESWTDEDQQNRINNIKLGIAKYGAITFDSSVDVYQVNRNPMYYNNNHPTSHKSGHALTVVGWDDNIAPELFGPVSPKKPGGWLIKDSWGADSHSSMHGFFWMSYESTYGACIGYKFSPTTDYDNNYHWDVGEPYNDQENAWGKYENAAIYPVLKANYDTEEYLKAINISMVGRNLDLTVDVYNNVPNVDRLDPNQDGINPRGGTHVQTIHRKFERGGTKTIQLDTPLKLERGQYFSIVAKVTNPTNDALISVAIDPTKDDMTYALVNGEWKNNHKNMGNGSAVARIRALTTEKKIADAKTDSLQYADVKLDTTNWRYGDKILPKPVQVKLGDTILSSQYYDVLYDEKSRFYKRGSDVWSNNEYIGYGFVTVRGKNGYTGQTNATYDILVGLEPDLENKGWYTRDYDDYPVVNIRVKKSAATYNDIPLPTGFSFENPSAPIDFKNPHPLDYNGPGSDYYRFTRFSGNRIVLYQMSSDDFEPIPGVDPEYDITRANVSLGKTQYEYTGAPIEPSPSVSIDGTQLREDRDYKVTYKDNTNIGTAKITITGLSNYKGSKEVSFEIIKAVNKITGFYLDDNNIPHATAKEGPVTFKYYNDVSCSDSSYIGTNHPTTPGTYYVKGFSNETANYTADQTEPKVFTILEDGKKNFSDAVINVSGTYSYTGQPIKPTLDVTYRGVKLKENVNYTITNSENTDAGDARVTVNGLGDYFGSQIVNFNISRAFNIFDVNTTIRDGEPYAKARFGTPEYWYYSDRFGNKKINKPTKTGIYYVQAVVIGTKNYTAAEGNIIEYNYTGETKRNVANTVITITQPNIVYDGTEKQPTFDVTYNGEKLNPATDYNYSYSNNTNAGNAAQITITGKGNYTGTKTQNFTIKKGVNEITDFIINGDEPYAKAKEGVVHFAYFSDKECTNMYPFKPKHPGHYYVMAYTDDTANLTRTHQGPIDFIITGDVHDLAGASVELSANRYTYNGKEHRPTVTVTNSEGVVLTQGTDYNIEYSNNTNATDGGAIVTITGIAPYKNQKKARFTIVKGVNEITEFKVEGNKIIATSTWDTPTVEYFYDEECTIPAGVEPDEPGLYYIRAKSKATDNYTSTTSKVLSYNVTIEQTDLSSAEVVIDTANTTYTGSTITPNVTVTLAGTVLRRDVDYTVEYANNVDASSNASLVIRGIKRYKGQINKTFTINRAPNTISNFEIVNNVPQAEVLDGVVSFEYYSDADGAHKIDTPKTEGTTYVRAISPTTQNYLSQQSEIKSFTINAKLKDLSGATVSINETNLVYTGNEITPTVNVISGGNTLQPNVDYIVEYNNNINAGVNSAQVIVKGIGAYTGTTTIPFTINKAKNEISGFKLIGNTPVANAIVGTVSFNYYSNEQCTDLVSGVPTSKGQYWIKAVSIGNENYESVTSTDKLTITITDSSAPTPDPTPAKIDINQVTVSVSTTKLVYNGLAQEPSITVTYLSETLVVNTDYTIKYEDNVNASSYAKVIITGMNRFIGVKETLFTINKAPNTISDFTVLNGEPSAKAINGNITYSYFRDRECKYPISKPNSSGTYFVKATSETSQNYESQSVVKEYQIEAFIPPKQELTLANTSIVSSFTRVEYTGNTVKPNIVVQSNGVTLQQGKDYTIKFNGDATSACLQQYTIIGINNYSGSVTGSYQILPGENTITKFEFEGNKPIVQTKYNTSYNIYFYSDFACKNKVQLISSGIYYAKVVSAGMDRTSSSRINSNYYSDSLVKQFYYSKDEQKNKQTTDWGWLSIVAIISGVVALGLIVLWIVLTVKESRNKNGDGIDDIVFTF